MNRTLLFSPKARASCAGLALVLLLAACGGGGDSASGTPAPGPTTVAKQCVATTAAVDLGTPGALLDLASPVVVELTSLSAPSTIVFQNFTSGGSFTITPYQLDPASACKTIGAPVVLAAGFSTSLVLTSFGTPGTRYFMDLQQATPSLVQICTQPGSAAGLCEPGKQTIFGSVLDNGSAAVASAKVTVANNGSIDATMTDAQGNFVLKTDASTLPSAFSATVSKTGYVPLALSFMRPTPARPISVRSQQMTAVGTDYAVIEVEPIVHHLGDGNFGGSANSAFQFPNAESSAFTRTFTVQAAALARPNATISFVAKGVECPDQVIVNGRLAFIAGNSAGDGSYSGYAVAVSSGMFVAGTNAISLVSKACSGTDLDDFEFQNIVIHFQ